MKDRLPDNRYIDADVVELEDCPEVLSMLIIRIEVPEKKIFLLIVLYRGYTYNRLNFILDLVFRPI